MRGNRFNVAKLTPLEWLTTSRNVSEVEPGLSRRDHHLGCRGEADAVEEVVQQLGGVPGAAGAHVVDAGRERLEQRSHPVERRLRPARHDRQRSLLGRGSAARDAGVDELDAALREAGVQRDRRARRGGAQIDDDLTRPAVLEDAVRARARPTRRPGCRGARAARSSVSATSAARLAAGLTPTISARSGSRS